MEEPSRQSGVAAPKLVLISSPFRRLYKPVTDFVIKLEEEHPHRPIAVILPELVENRWWHFLLHNQTAPVMKAYLLYSGQRRVVVIAVPWYPR